jgi:hypothetical protein
MQSETVARRDSDISSRLLKGILMAVKVEHRVGCRMFDTVTARDSHDGIVNGAFRLYIPLVVCGASK